jgi:hypothetical protein
LVLDEDRDDMSQRSLNRGGFSAAHQLLREVTATFRSEK